MEGLLMGLLAPRSWAQSAIADRFAQRRENRLREARAAEAAGAVEAVMGSEGYRNFVERNPTTQQHFGLWGAMAGQPGLTGAANSLLLTGLSDQWQRDRATHAAQIEMDVYKQKKQFDWQHKMAQMQTVMGGENAQPMLFDWFVRENLGKDAGEGYMWARDASGNLRKNVIPGSKLGLELQQEMHDLETQLNVAQQAIGMVESPDQFQEYFRRGEFRQVIGQLVYGQAQMMGQGDIGGEAFDRMLELVIGDPEALAMIKRAWYQPGSVGLQTAAETARQTEVMRGALKRLAVRAENDLRQKYMQAGFDSTGRILQNMPPRSPYLEETRRLRPGKRAGDWYVGTDPKDVTEQYNAQRGVRSLDDALERGIPLPALPSPNMDRADEAWRERENRNRSGGW